MENSYATNDLLWEKARAHNAHRAQKDIEHSEWLKNFALALAMIVLTLAVAAGLAGLVNDGPIRV